MRFSFHVARRMALAVSVSLVPLAAHAASDAGQITEIIVRGHRTAPDVPTTSESVTADTLAKTVNIVTPEDAVRYLPDTLVRQRHFGDTQSPVTTRTSGVGASARSLIYVDGVLLSSLIGNNNTSASPKWGLVAPEAIARVDVIYGPFSAAYAGNSLGSVIAFTTRMPAKPEAGLEVQGASQAFRKYGDDDDYGTFRVAASVGDRAGRTAWRLSVNHLDSHAQPLSYITAATAPAGSSGAFDGLSRTRAPLKILGSGGLEHQVQDNLSGRITYDVTPGVTAAYTFGWFRNDDDASVHSFLRDAAGAPVYTAAFASGRYALKEDQLMQGLSLTSHGGGVFDYAVTATVFRYLDSRQRTPASLTSGTAGSEVRLDGTGWTTFDARGTWRPEGSDGSHVVSFGAHQDHFRLNNPKFALADWSSGGVGARTAFSGGDTKTQALWLQDVIHLAPRTHLTAGVRFEHWRAYNGYNYSAMPSLDVRQPRLARDAVSPKIVLAFNPEPDWTLKASLGAATRFPTVTELYQVVTTGNVLSVPDPNLRPERALSSELSAEKAWPDASLRLSLFDERISDALLSQSAPLVAGSSTLYSYVQNVGRTHVTGVELSGDRQDWLVKGLEISGWVTLARGRIERDAVFAAAEGKDLPQLPRLRGAVVITYAPTPRWDVSIAARYSDRAFATLDNSDTYANTWQGFSGYTVVDLHARYKLAPRWSAQVGIDNLNNRHYLLFHPFPQRTVMASLKYTL